MTITTLIDSVDGVNYDQPTCGDFSISVYNEILMPKKLR